MRFLALALALSGCLLSGSEAKPGGDDGPPPIDQCPDGAFEPNDTRGSAFPTGVSTSMSGTTLPGLALCGATDTDIYRVDLTDSEVVVLVTNTFEDSSLIPGTVLLDNTGIMIAGSGSQDATSTVLCTVVPAGSYFIEVTGPSTNYRLDIDTFLGGSCP